MAFGLDFVHRKHAGKQAVVASIYQRPDGSFGTGSGGPGTTNIAPGAIVVNINTGGAPADGKQIATDISRYLYNRGRAGALA